jgi:hypothetical protein
MLKYFGLLFMFVLLCCVGCVYFAYLALLCMVRVALCASSGWLPEDAHSIQLHILEYSGLPWIISLMKQQTALTHTGLQNDVSTLLDSWVKKTSSIKILCLKKIAFPYIFVKIWHAYKCLYMLKDLSSFFCLL